MGRRLSLRARLILGVIALAGIGLVTADVVTYTSLHSFLVSRTDDFLDTAHSSAESALQGPSRGHPRGGEPPSSSAQDPDIGRLEARVPGLFVQVRRPNGTIVATGAAPQFPGTKQAAPPRLPATIVPTTRRGADRVTYFTVGATKGGERYRVRASIDPNSNGYTLIVATSLTSVDSTLHRLVLVELLVTLAVLAGVAILGFWVIRVGLRPLTEIGATAATIAAGDLSHRVAREDDRTEVGRLGRALNAMLAQIESAFNAREASERKLRRFVADASHELRTPLAAVRAYAELFSRGAAQRPADLERSMAGITRESERMSVLVDDLLLLARLDEGRPLERERVELHDVVAESVETARMLEPDACDRLPPRSGDRRRRSRPPAAGGRQSLLERARACRRGCVRRRALGTRRRGRSPDRHRQRSRSCARPGRARLRALLPCRSLAGARSRRCRSRPFDRSGRDGGPGRSRDRVRSAPWRCSVHDRASACDEALGRSACSATCAAASAPAPKRRIRPPKAIAQTANQAQPSARPAITSVSQWTSSSTRLAATATAIPAASPQRSSLRAGPATPEHQRGRGVERGRGRRMAARKRRPERCRDGIERGSHAVDELLITVS